MSELFLTPPIIITFMILLAITGWIMLSYLMPTDPLDSTFRRTQLFRYLDALGNVLSGRGNSKTKALYYKSYMALLVTLKPAAADPVAKYNKNVIDRMSDLNEEDINHETLLLINELRKIYKIPGLIEMIHIPNLKNLDQTKRPPAKPDCG